MKIDSNTTIEEVKQKTKDSLDGLCNIKNNESDNGKTSKELFDTYRISTARKSFSEYDFIRLFLAYLVVKGITKIDIVKLKFELVKYYKNEKYSLLFEEISLKQQIEGDFVELEDCLLNARLCGLLSNSIQGTNERKIFIEEPSKIYNSYSDNYRNPMHQLVSEYINELKKPKVAIVGTTKMFMSSFIEKLNNNEFVKDTCPQVGQEFNPTDETIEDQLKKYNELLDSGILDNTTKDCRTCQNMSCRVEQNEKPVDGCLGYINHGHDKKEEKGKQLVKTIGDGK